MIVIIYLKLTCPKAKAGLNTNNSRKISQSKLKCQRKIVPPTKTNLISQINPTHLSPHNSHSKNYRSDDGNGHIPSLRESVLAPEVDTVPRCLAHRLSSLEDTTIQERMKDTPISTIPTFSMSMPTNLLSLKYQGHHQHQDIRILPSWQVQR